jgi:hypothetical protein
MKKLFFILLLAVSLFFGCGNTTNSLIYTEYSNILTFVYVAKHGYSFHTYDCYLIQDSDKIKIRRNEATEKGYTPCSVCIY